MRTALLLAAAWLLTGCAGHSAPRHALLPTPRREVTAIAAFTGLDLPRAYQRLHDGPGWKWVLWSHEMLCVVDSGTWTRTQVGDRVRCDWRVPRA
jgi:hypothetical protein